MLATIDSDGKFSSLFMTKIPEMTKSVEEQLAKIAQFQNTNTNISSAEWENFAKNIDITDKNLMRFIKDDKYAVKSQKNFNTALKAYSRETEIATIKTKALGIAKNLAINAGIALAMYAITSAIQYATEATDRFREAQQNIIDSANEQISKYDSEIDSLTALQQKLIDAKGNKTELASIQVELNKAIGETPGLVNGEADAWENVNSKLEQQIKLQKVQREEALKTKIKAAKTSFNNNKIENKGWGLWEATDYNLSHYFDKNVFSGFAGNHDYDNLELLKAGITVPVSELKDLSVREAYDKITKNGYQGTSEDLWSFLIKNSDSFTEQITPEEVADFLKAQLESAKDVFSDYLSSADSSIFSSTDLNGMLTKFVYSGMDLDDIHSAFETILNGNDLEDLRDKYLDSLNDPNADSEGILADISAEIDVLKDKYPTATSYFDNFINHISDGLTKASEISKIAFVPSDIFGLKDGEESTELGKISDEIDNIQSAYKTLNSAIDEYNSTGSISADTLQSVIALGDNWLDYLVDEEGNSSLVTSFNEALACFSFCFKRRTEVFCNLFYATCFLI